MQKELYKITEKWPVKTAPLLYGEYAEIIRKTPHKPMKIGGPPAHFYYFQFYDFDGKNLIRRNTNKIHENLIILGESIELKFDAILYP